MTPVLDAKKIAESNSAVDVKKLEEVQQIRQLLESAGIRIKADYRLSPALRPGKTKAAGRIVRLIRHQI
ncbi:MAG: hypothetical protein L0215_13280 [Gemmataceae bacterium]|nr:hypothetical protein [Gemmataceae bacterium]